VGVIKTRNPKSAASRCVALHRAIAALSVIAVAALGGCQPSSGYSLPIPRIRSSDPFAPKLTPATTTPSPSRRIDNDIPDSRLPEWGEVPGRWQGILIHHTVTQKGPAAFIDKLHRQRGWEGLGYHFVINNGKGAPDGKIEVGFRWRIQREGAHCRDERGADNYWNEHTIGIALIGNFEKHRPTEAQYRSLTKLVHFLQKRYDIPLSKIKGHSSVEPTKCPGKYFSLARLHRLLRQR